MTHEEYRIFVIGLKCAADTMQDATKSNRERLVAADALQPFLEGHSTQDALRAGAAAVGDAG